MADHYFVAIYDDIKKRWYHDLWTDATGRDEGDVYDNEADDEVWRFADNSIAPNEEEVNGKAWDIFATAISSLPPIALANDEEPDVIY
jgi:hypothetical protein